MYRPEIKVLDATIRDGGIVNEWDFSHENVRDVYQALLGAGVDYMEIGYRADKKLFDPKDFGLWRFCDEEDIRKAVEEIYDPALKLTVMCDVGRTDLDSILPAEESLVDTIRVATYIKDIDKAISLANHCHEKGYGTTLNIMAISHALEPELEEGLAQVNEETHVKAVYIVDSFGSLYSEQIHWLVELYRKHLTTCEVGIHTHNNQQLGFANTIEAIRKGANYLDATIYGIGRGAGNCPLELLLGFLKNPKFNLRPVLDILGRVFVPLREQKLEWGYLIPYMLTGILDQHPRDAIAHLKSEERGDFVKFYHHLKNIDEVVD
jgi:4-hydroxy 2-oxovalerate aldolase